MQISKQAITIPHDKSEYNWVCVAFCINWDPKDELDLSSKREESKCNQNRNQTPYCRLQSPIWYGLCLFPQALLIYLLLAHQCPFCSLNTLSVFLLGSLKLLFLLPAPPPSFIRCTSYWYTKLLCLGSETILPSSALRCWGWGSRCHSCVRSPPSPC